MAKMLRVLGLGLAMLALLAAAPAWAQTAETTADTAATDTVVVDDTLEGITIDEPQTAPGTTGLWWRGLRERVSLIFTFDPVKKAEKQIKYAEERMQLAEKFLESDNEQARERAEQMMARADELVARMEANRDRWINHPEARKRSLLKNVANHQLRKNKVLDRVEEKLSERDGEKSEEMLERLQELKEKSSERSRRLLNAISNENVPEEVREHLQRVKDRVEEHHQKLLEFKEDKRSLMDRIRNGDEGAREELRELMDARRDEMKARDVRRVIDRARPDTTSEGSARLRPDAVRDKIMEKRDATADQHRPATKPTTRVIRPGVNVVPEAVRRLDRRAIIERRDTVVDRIKATDGQAPATEPAPAEQSTTDRAPQELSPPVTDEEKTTDGTTEATGDGSDRTDTTDVAGNDY